MVVRACVYVCDGGAAGLVEVRRQVLWSQFFPPSSMWDLEI